MLRNKKFLLGAVVVVFISVIFGGCVKNDVPTSIDKGSRFDKPQYTWNKNTGEKLVIWTMEKELDRIYMKRALARYCNLTGDKIETVDIPKDQFEARMRSAFVGDGEKPDIVLSYGGANLLNYRPDANFYDFSTAVWLDDLIDTALNQTVLNGRVIGLPHWEASISGMLYNKEIFKKHGLAVPQNQAEFMAVCERLRQVGVTPVYLPGAEISMLLYQFPLDVLVQDSAKLAALNTGTLTYSAMPEMKRILEWYRTMATKGYFGSSYETDNWDGMNAAMKSDKYAMMICWDTWLYTDFDGDKTKFGLMPAFMGVPDKGTFEGPNLALFIVNKNTPRLDAALNFITFMADPYNYNVAFAGIYTAPVFKNQVANISTPQYVASESLIESKYNNSTAWLRIKGFSQMDAVCILKYMRSSDDYTAEKCLAEMDALRRARVGY